MYIFEDLRVCQGHKIYKNMPSEEICVRFLSFLHFYIRISELLRPSFKSFNLCKIIPNPMYRPLGYCRIIADNHTVKYQMGFLWGCKSMRSKYMSRVACGTTVCETDYRRCVGAGRSIVGHLQRSSASSPLVSTQHRPRRSAPTVLPSVAHRQPFPCGWSRQ